MTRSEWIRGEEAQARVMVIPSWFVPAICAVFFVISFVAIYIVNDLAAMNDRLLEDLMGKRTAVVQPKDEPEIFESQLNKGSEVRKI